MTCKQIRKNAKIFRQFTRDEIDEHLRENGDLISMLADGANETNEKNSAEAEREIAKLAEDRIHQLSEERANTMKERIEKRQDKMARLAQMKSEQVLALKIESKSRFLYLLFIL